MGFLWFAQHNAFALGQLSLIAIHPDWPPALLSRLFQRSAKSAEAEFACTAEKNSVPFCLFSSARSTLGSDSVLILFLLDNDTSSVRALSELANGLSVTVRSFDDGERCLEQLQSSDCDLIFADLDVIRVC